MSKFKTNDEYFAFAKTLAVIPSEDLLVLLKNYKIKIPTYIHRFVLKETLYPKVFQTKLYESYTDELKYRLRGYRDYSLFLLERLIEDYNLDFDAARYKEIFFNLLFLNRDLYGLKNSFIDDLEKLKYKYTVDLERITYRTFRDLIQPFLYEPSGFLDGISLKILKDVLIHSCTLGDLRGLGDKYGVKVPRRINKGTLINILAARFRLTEEEAKLLDDKSVLDLEIYAKEKGFNISIDLKKSDMVEYMIFDLKKYHQEAHKDLHNYEIPLATDADSVKVDAIEFQSNDQDIPVLEPDAPVEMAVEEEEEEMMVEPILSEPLPESEPEPIISPEPVVIPEDKPIESPKAVASAEPKKEPDKVKETVKPEEMDFSAEEKDLLDEKINLIIKKYHKRRRVRRFWTIFSIVLAVLILGFIGYSFYYYTVLNPGNLPLGIPVFWE
ncbi:MAG: hypothetical protein PHP61_00505 [Candidatus Izemoplasmatales bacterium]|jgi:hypothetical protein|nr:hypothetical protein [Candidatus Izemoplasmatales bacterium]MDD4354364.1 hypothetical protein [Candidatus Izemoplasmatales bacterium]MDD4987793.1 hypothetical protein [Candidatus Izemoplasmatales bacterium]MDY0373858.1 hypothetical protein [Candidatus Izemoplasmatales bacterium]NLF48404.1 hypothetical protein [Acholeplasmataceae bacterium]